MVVSYFSEDIIYVSVLKDHMCASFDHNITDQNASVDRNRKNIFLMEDDKKCGPRNVRKYFVFLDTQEDLALLVGRVPAQVCNFCCFCHF